jgi:hypothetical protein
MGGAFVIRPRARSRKPYRSHMRAERSDKHQRAVDLVGDLVAIQLGAGDAVAAELLGRIAEA